MGGVALAQPAPTVKPEPASQARLIDVEATGLFQRGQYRAALGLFKETFALVPNATTAWNIARCYEELQELAYAREAFAALYLQGFPDLPPDKQTRARERIQDLDRRIEAWQQLQKQADYLLRYYQYKQALSRLKEAWALNHDPSTQWGLLCAWDKLDRTDDLLKGILTYSELSGVTDADRRRAQLLLQQHEQRLRSAASAPLSTPPGAQADSSSGNSGSSPLDLDDSSGASKPLAALQKIGLLAVGVGGGLIVGGGALRLSYQDEVQEIQTTSDPNRYDDLLQVIEAREPITLGLLGGGTGLLIAGLGLFFWGGEDDEEPTATSLWLIVAPSSFAVQGAF